MAGRPKKKIDTETYVGQFATKLTSLRIKAELTVDGLAEKSGISRAALYTWESGDFTPNVEQIEMLADALGIEPHLLLPRRKKPAEKKTVPRKKK